MFDRGFTGHEHLDEFGLINMNGRVYDPALGRFLSPDPYVQAPEYTQNYNRYTYALNNPLKYTDPSGEFIHLIIGAVVGGVMNWVGNGMQFNAQGLGAFFVGAAAGALAAGIGAGVAALFQPLGSFGGAFLVGAGSLNIGFIGGAAMGAAAGFANGFVSGIGNSLLGGKNIGQAIGNGFGQGIRQAWMGAATGGIMSGISSATKGGNFWTGKQYNMAITVERVDFTMPEQRVELNVGNLSDINNVAEEGRLFTNPSGGVIRVQDGHGAGHYGAPRGNRAHLGIDLVTSDGQNIISPVDGTATNFTGATTNYPIVDIIPSDANLNIDRIRILYVNAPNNVNAWTPYNVQAGQLIGTSTGLQSLGYPAGMTPHIHLQMMQNGQWINPTTYFFNP